MPVTVTPISGSLGNKETATLTAYTVTSEAGSAITSIVEKVNGVTVNTYNNPASLSRTLTVPTATWDALAYFASHTASVTVTDSNGATTVTTYSFDKRLATGASLLEATKANTDAKNRIAQKRDALAAQVGLSAGSTFDAIRAQLASGVFKKFAEGSATLPSSTLTFTNRSGASVNHTYISVSGLTFRPKTIMVFSKTNDLNVTSYTAEVLNSGFEMVSVNTISGDTIRLTGNAFVTSTGFQLPTQSSGLVFWRAYE